MVEPFDGSPVLPNVMGIQIYDAANVVPPPQATAHPCRAANNCHRGTSWCSHVETDPLLCPAYTELPPLGPPPATTTAGAPPATTTTAGAPPATTTAGAL